MPNIHLTPLAWRAGLLLAALPLGTLHAQTPATGSDEVIELQDFVTTATRVEKPLGVIPQTVSLIEADALADQLTISSDLMASISTVAPSYSPSRGKMTGAGETFRGRNPLFMIDGVPQSNPLRDGGRDGYTIDPAMIERIEIVHGASAAQGMGATGGIINFVTASAPTAEGMEQHVDLRLTIDDGFHGEGFGQRAAYRLGYRAGALGVVGAVAYEWRPMAYDGEGRLIGIDNTQGDTMNSHSLDLYGKIAYTLSPDQALRLTVNHFNMKQDLEYTTIPRNLDPATGPLYPVTTSEKGETPGKATQNDVTTVSLGYRHAAFLGGSLAVDLFHNEFAATYGGGDFATFVDNGVRIFDQSENQSDKNGLKLTFARSLEGLADIVTGVDYFSDTTKQILAQTGREWVPETTYQSWAPYLQLERGWGPLALSGGVRYESAELTVDDFVTLESYGSQAVAGGNPDFEEVLFNVGATYAVTETATLFATYAQGFGMPDVGRVLRGINQPGQDVDDFLQLEPIVTDNYEFGVRVRDRSWKGALSYFYSTSELGSRLSLNTDGIFVVNREPIDTWGVEARLEFEWNETHTLGSTFAWVEGQSDADGDGRIDDELDGANIPPVRLNLHWSAQWSEAWRTRLQSATYFDNEGRGFEGHTLFDFLASYATGFGTFALGVENVLDETYITYYSQTVAATNAARYFAGRGRVFSLRYRRDF